MKVEIADQLALGRSTRTRRPPARKALLAWQRPHGRRPPAIGPPAGVPARGLRLPTGWSLGRTDDARHLSITMGEWPRYCGCMRCRFLVALRQWRRCSGALCWQLP